MEIMVIRDTLREWATALHGESRAHQAYVRVNHFLNPDHALENLLRI